MARDASRSCFDHLWGVNEMLARWTIAFFAAMLAFFRKEGFVPAPRLCVELAVQFPDREPEPAT